jgi:hypothetical protein
MASAANLAVRGGVSFPDADTGNTSQGLIGGEFTVGVSSLFRLGVVYEHITDLDFIGGMVRLGIPLSGFFGDFQLGKPTQDHFDLGYGFGAGYMFGLVPKVSFGPRVGYRKFTGDFDTKTLDFMGLLELDL